jgi:hypothetical protein
MCSSFLSAKVFTSQTSCLHPVVKMQSMKLTILFLVLSSVIMYTESALILAGIIAVKAAIVGAFIIGGIAGGLVGSAARNNRGRSHGHGRGRYGRSVADVDEMFLVPMS